MPGTLRRFGAFFVSDVGSFDQSEDLLCGSVWPGAFHKALEGIFALSENFSFVLFRLWTYCEIGGCLPSGVGPSTRVLRFLSSTSAKMERAQRWKDCIELFGFGRSGGRSTCTVVFGFGRSGGHSPPLVRRALSRECVCLVRAIACV